MEGTIGQASGGMYLVETVADVESLRVADETKLAYVTQTTLSVDDASEIVAALRKRFPLIQGPKKDDICYATQNRQEAANELAAQCDFVIVVGVRTVQIPTGCAKWPQRGGVDSRMVDNASEIDPAWFAGKQRVGVTAGASAPEVLVDAVIERLRGLGLSTLRQDAGLPENVSFPLPVELQR